MKNKSKILRHNGPTIRSIEEIKRYSMVYHAIMSLFSDKD